MVVNMSQTIRRDLLIPINCTSFKTKQLARLLARVYDEELSCVGLKTTQFSLLTVISNHGPIAPGELARRAGLEASTLTRNLRPLISNGWALQSDGLDGRSRSISITRSGRAKQANAQKHWLRAQTKVTTVFSPTKVLALQELIDDFMTKVKTELHGGTTARG